MTFGLADDGSSARHSDHPCGIVLRSHVEIESCWQPLCRRW